MTLCAQVSPWTAVARGVGSPKRSAHRRWPAIPNIENEHNQLPYSIRLINGLQARQPPLLALLEI
jgi:hypothetical protein